METYNLTLIGSVDDIKSCNKIILYNSYDGYPNLTIQNYNQVLNLLKSSSTYLTIKKENDIFYYNRSNGIIYGFNNIIFLGANDSVFGFKYYSEIQGRNLNYNIKIIVNDNGELIKSFVGELDTSLANIEYSNASLNSQFLGDTLDKYTSSKKIFSELKKSNGLYTPSIYDVENNINKVISVGNKNSVGKVWNEYTKKYELKYIAPNILNNILYDIHKVGYNRFSVGYHGPGNDIVLYEWKNIAILKENSTEVDYYTDYFNIISLTRLNKFSNPISYLKREIRCNTSEGNLSGGWYLPKYNDNFKKAEILYTSGKYIIGKVYFSDNTSDIRVFNSENIEEWTPSSLEKSGFWDNEFGENLENRALVLDELSMYPEIINIGKSNKSLVYSEVIEKLPELVNNFSNFRNFFDKYSNTLKVIKKTRDWTLFNYKDQSNVDIYKLSGVYGNLYLSSEDLQNLIIIDSLNVLLKNEDYYILYNLSSTDSRELSTENARNLLEGGTLVKEDKYTINNGGVNDKLYEDYYKQGVIELISKDSSLYNSPLNKFRKNFYPTNIEGIPDIICACNGYIFYINNDKLNYL